LGPGHPPIPPISIFLYLFLLFRFFRIRKKEKEEKYGRRIEEGYRGVARARIGQTDRQGGFIWEFFSLTIYAKL
jgi:hypothetical protein